MLFVRKSPYLLALLLLLSVAGLDVSASHAQQDDSVEGDFKTGPSLGQSTFTSTCAGCHGLDGRGGERAPNIAGGAKAQPLSEAQIAGIISNGIPGTGMPAFHRMNPAEVRAVVSYLHVLQGNAAARTTPGNPARGKNMFFGKAECSSCHTVSGEGGFLGPDLTAYGSEISAKAIQKAILNPARIVPAGYRLAAVTARDGNRVEGVVRNEDNFSVQLQAKDGSFHFFQKGDVRSLEYLGQSLMPTTYGERLTRGELDDLVSYLMSTGSPKVTRAFQQY